MAGDDDDDDIYATSENVIFSCRIQLLRWISPSNWVASNVNITSTQLLNIYVFTARVFLYQKCSSVSCRLQNGRPQWRHCVCTHIYGISVRLHLVLPKRKHTNSHKARNWGILELLHFYPWLAQLSITCMRHTRIDSYPLSNLRIISRKTWHITLIPHYTLSFSHSQSLWICQTDTKRNFCVRRKYLDELLNFLLTSMPICILHTNQQTHKFSCSRRWASRSSPE